MLVELAGFVQEVHDHLAVGLLVERLAQDAAGRQDGQLGHLLAQLGNDPLALILDVLGGLGLDLARFLLRLGQDILARAFRLLRRLRDDGLRFASRLLDLLGVVFLRALCFFLTRSAYSMLSRTRSRRWFSILSMGL